MGITTLVHNSVMQVVQTSLPMSNDMQRIIVLLEKLSDERIREVYDFTLFISSREANTPDDKHWDDLLAKTPQTLVDRFIAEAAAAHANGSAIHGFGSENIPNTKNY